MARRLRKLRVRKGLLLRCPECGAARAKRQLWRHFRLFHPDLAFNPIGRYEGGKMYWAVGPKRPFYRVPG